MPTKEELRNRLVEKLRELFQLDRPELDFGLYRIMHAKDEEVTDYLENGLPATLEEALGNVNQEEIEQRKREYEEELQTAKDYGVENPEEADKVQEARERLEVAKESADADKRVYDHLYRFFGRYYEKGDFITRRYRVRETDTQAAPYAVPYNGEEVKLHWANADQYYIKTAEHLRNFRFDLWEAVEETSDGNAPDLDLAGDEVLPVHFRVVDGEEGEHDNVKDSDNKVRKLKPYTPDLLDVTDDGELVVNYEVVFQKSQGEYIYDDEMEEHLEDKYGTSVGKRDKEPLAVAETVFDHLSGMEELDPAYEDLLRYVPPPNNKSTPPLLARYYEQFVDKHEMDYFIHKDLGSFLRRELDFYIKNEVMRLDDIERAEAPRVESYLDVVKALRRAAHDIIDFLAQLEDFQKKLWLKKKFVVDTGYCVTLDRVPDALYGTILENDAQLEEWRDLYAVEEWEDNLFSRRQHQEDIFTHTFLDSHPHFMVDTRHFGPAFTNRLLASLGDQTEGGLSKIVDGRCIQSENFQALNLLKTRYRSRVDYVYIDPPYNTDENPIIYKNDLRSSSWASLMAGRIELDEKIRRPKTLRCIAIDDAEYHNLRGILRERSQGVLHATAAVRSKPQGRPTLTGFSANHDYAVFWGAEDAEIGRLPRRGSKAERYPHEDEHGTFAWANFRKAGTDSNRSERPKSHYPVYVDLEEESIRVPSNMEWKDDDDEWEIYDDPDQEEQVVWPIDSEGNEKVWVCSAERAIEEIEDIRIGSVNKDKIELQKKYRPNQDGSLPGTWWEDSRYSASESGTKLLKSILGHKKFDFPKSINLVEDCIRVGNIGEEGIVLDYFAGSGTTGHAVMRMNRDSEVEGKERQYILVDMGDYFDTVMLPRLKKVAFSDEWDDGVPKRIEGQTHVIKYHRLESYEDTLNNLELHQDADRQEALEKNEDLRRDYRLHYMLDVETEGSPSLLDIDEFTDPRQYHLQVKKPGSDASTQTSVDLLETFNYLLGLRVEQINMPETFTAEFHRPEDPELPEDERTRLEIDGEMEPDEDGDWWFRTVTGWVPSDPMNPDDSDRECVLVIWRTLTDDRERDNAMLNAYVEGQRDDLLDADRVYVNGSNNLASLRREDEDWEVHLLEKEFMERMWDVQDV